MSDKWKVGDVLESEYGYKVRVYRDADGACRCDER